MFRNKPHSLEESSPHPPLPITAVWKYLPIQELTTLKKKTQERVSWAKVNLAQWRKKEAMLDPTAIQQLKLTEIGVQLQKLRRSKSLSLESITLQTQIPQRLLEAIEAGDLDNLPEPIYVRGLIKQFADALGLDGNSLSHQLPLAGNLVKRSPGQEGAVTFFQIQPLHLYVFYILVVILSVQGISNLLRQSGSDVAFDEQALPLPSLTTLAPPVSKPVANPQPIPTDKVIVEVKISEDSWVKVMVDGKSDFEGILPKGTHRTWTGQKAVTMRAGNAGGVQVTVNQQKLQPLGKAGQIQEVTYKVPTQS